MATLRFQKTNELKIPTPWGQISAKGWGNPERYPVLGLHGYMDNGGTFDRLAPLLTSSIYFVAIDLPGHGLSTPIPAGLAYHYGDYSIIVRRIQLYFKWDKFSIIGHSMGAGIAALYAALFPEVVDRIVLIDVMKPISFDVGMRSPTYRKDLDEFMKIEMKGDYKTSVKLDREQAINMLISATDESLTKVGAECLAVRGLVSAGGDKWTFRHDLRVRIPSFYRFDHQLSLEFLMGICCHSLFIKAKGSPYFDPMDVVKNTMELYEKSCKSFKKVEVEGTHYVHLNDPAPVANHINEFIVVKDEE